MLKDVSRSDADQLCDLRIILIATQKNYVLDAPLGDGPIAGVEAHVMNVWQARYDDYLIVQCVMLYGLESGLEGVLDQGVFGQPDYTFSRTPGL